MSAFDANEPTPAGLVFTDSAGRQHRLAEAKRLSIPEVARRLNCSEATIHRRIKAGEIYPILRHSARKLEIYECGLVDFLERSTVGVYHA